MADTKKKDVNYDFEVVGELPIDDNEIRRSVLRDQIARVVGDESNHRKWARIASYGDKGGASGAATTLRYRHGDSPDVDGFTFRTKRESGETEDSPRRTSLFVHYDPEAIVDGAREAFEKKMKAKEAARTAAKKKAAAEG